MVIPKPKADQALPILAVAFSAYSLSNNYDATNLSAFITSVVGLVAGILFLFRKAVFHVLIQIWIYAQFPVIVRHVWYYQAEDVKVTQEIPIIAAAQTPVLSIGGEFNGVQSGLELRLNLIPFLFLGTYKVLLLANLVGRRVTISRFRTDNKLGDVFPINGAIVRKVDLHEDKHWVLLQLDKMLQHGTTPYSHVLIKSKDGEVFKPGKKKVISYLRLVRELDQLDKKPSKELYPFVDWGVVQVLK